MNRSHGLIAVGGVVCLAIGFTAGSFRSTSATAGKTGELSSNGRLSKSSSREREREIRVNSGDEMLAGILNGRSIKDLSNEELTTILQRLSKYDSTQRPLERARQSYQLQLLLAKLPISKLEETAEAMVNDPERGDNGSLNTVMRAMASKDAHHAVAWAKTQKNSSTLLSIVLVTMGKDDPIGAADIYREGMLDGTLSGMNAWQASYGIGTGMARLGKKALLDFEDSLPKQLQANIISNCYLELPQNDREEMLNEIYQRFRSDSQQEWSFKSMFFTALNTDRLQAKAWVAKMEPGKERASLELSAANSYARTGDQDAVREWLSRAIISSPGKEKELFNEGIDEMINNNPGNIAVFASLLPEGVELRAEDLKNHAKSTAYRGFNGLSGMAVAIRDPAERTKLIVNALEEFTKTTQQSSQRSQVNANDFDVFTHQLQTLNLTGDDATKVAEALAAARNATPKAKN